MSRGVKVKFDAILNIDEREILERLGLGSDRALQRVVDEAVIRECDPYVPMDMGTLKDSALINTVRGSGRVVYKTPYARRLYYNPQYHFNGQPTRGGMWFHRAMANGGRERILKELKEAAAKRQRRRK